MSLELQAACDRLLTSKTTRPGDVMSLQMALGSDRFYDVHIGALAGPGKGGGAVVVFHDISELKRLEKVRQDFVANVSHELRTPLTSIKGYAETLLSDNEPDSQTLTSFLQVILKNANHMVKMVDDLLQLARLEGKSEPPQFVPVDAVDALSAAWKACLPMADAKSIKLVNTLPAAGVNVIADQDQIVQVFLNLIENGIKYSPAGETLQVSHSVDGGMVTFSVRDNGPGIPKHHQKRIFERFYRVEKHRGSTSGSTGLGLAICRHIIQNHGGSISVQSPNPDSLKGSTFQFTMRAAEALPQRPTAEAEGTENA
jgi:two-component system phosphate regulon sensor histidine kinase PhoR